MSNQAQARESWFQEGVRAERKRCRRLLQRLARECDVVGIAPYAWAAKAYRNAVEKIDAAPKKRGKA